MKHIHQLLAFALVLLASGSLAQAQQKITPKTAVNSAPKVLGSKGVNPQLPKTAIQNRNLGAGSQNVVLGGSDSCSAPQAVTGQGVFPFNNSAATTGAEGQTETICYQFGSSTVDNDVWFVWTADATGTALIETCTGTSIDSKLAAYPSTGACPTLGTSLSCNDDACGVQSAITFACVTGTDYLIQVGNSPGYPGGTGTFSVSVSGPASNDDCATPTSIAGQGQFPYTQIGATTGTAGQTEYACVNFGHPISLKEYMAGRDVGLSGRHDDRWRGEIESLGEHLMKAVGDVVPVLPVSMVATVFLAANGKQLSELELKSAVHDLIVKLEATGARVYVPRSDQAYAVVVGLRMLELRHMVIEEDGLYRANPDELPILTYYANSIAHLLPETARDVGSEADARWRSAQA